MLVQKELKNAYIGGYTLKTFTVTRTETSDPTQFNPVYSDDATGLTAGSTSFDEFFGYSAVRLSTAGVETAEVTQSTPGTLDITQLGDLTTGDNVMIKFPVRGIKMTKNGSSVTLSITEKPNQTGYQYFAHSRGTISSPVLKDALYIGAYVGYNSSNTLKSWSGKSPTTSTSISNFINYARANDGNSGNGGYDIIGYYQREYINALYMMKYGSPHSQSVVGAGRTSASSKTNTGGTNSQTDATYGTSSASDQVKLFGLEDRWGNIHQWLGGASIDSSKNLYIALSGFVGSTSTSSPYENVGAINTNGENYYCISGIVGDNGRMFGPTSTVNNSSMNTYYCDHSSVAGNSNIFVGGSYGAGVGSGAFSYYADMGYISHAQFGTRLMYV